MQSGKGNARCKSTVGCLHRSSCSFSCSYASWAALTVPSCMCPPFSAGLHMCLTKKPRLGMGIFGGRLAILQLDDLPFLPIEPISMIERRGNKTSHHEQPVHGIDSTVMQTYQLAFAKSPIQCAFLLSLTRLQLEQFSGTITTA